MYCYNLPSPSIRQFWHCRYGPHGWPTLRHLHRSVPSGCRMRVARWFTTTTQLTRTTLPTRMCSTPRASPPHRTLFTLYIFCNSQYAIQLKQSVWKNQYFGPNFIVVYPMTMYNTSWHKSSTVKEWKYVVPYVPLSGLVDKNIKQKNYNKKRKTPVTSRSQYY